MFWQMAGLSTTSPVETILDKDNFTLEELLDEDELIQECKALNGRLINFLQERDQIEQLVRYIVEEAPDGADNRRAFKFPFIACEVFTCEIDVILKALVEDGELMNLLFSFLNANRSRCTMLAGYFSKVVICLMLRKTVPFMQYIQGHEDIISHLVDLIGITSIMEVLIRLVGADEYIYANHTEAMKWIEDMNILEMIVDKFSKSDCPEVHANAAEILCAVTRFAPPGLAAKICSPSFIGRLFSHALENSRPKSVLVNSLVVCISILDPKRQTAGTYYIYNRQLTQGSTTVSASPATVEGMLDSLGNLLKLLDVLTEECVLLTTYGKLQPPLGKHRLKIVEFISVLLTIGSEAAEKAMIHHGAVKRVLDLFFEYPYNNFLHHHVENIISSCLESKNATLLEYLIHDCDLVGKILNAEINFTLTSDPNKPSVSIEGRPPPKIGNMGHLTRISNKLVQLGSSISSVQAFLQGNNEWIDWQKNVLSKRNALENVYQWACGRPTSLHDQNRDSDDDDYQDRDYDVAALANNLSHAFRFGVYNNDNLDETHGALERDDEDVYFDDESAEVVISSLRLGEDQESSSLFSSSNWFALEDDRVVNNQSSGPDTSSSPMDVGCHSNDGVTGNDEVGTGEEEELVDTASSPLSAGKLDEGTHDNLSREMKEAGPNESDEGAECVQGSESSDPVEPLDADKPHIIPIVEQGTNESDEGVECVQGSESSDPVEPLDADKALIIPSVEQGPNEGDDDAECVQKDESSDPVKPLHADKAPIIPSVEQGPNGSDDGANSVQESESSGPVEPLDADKPPIIPSVEQQVESDTQGGSHGPDESGPSSSPETTLVENNITAGESLAVDGKPSSGPSEAASLDVDMTVGKEDTPDSSKPDQKDIDGAKN